MAYELTLEVKIIAKIGNPGSFIELSLFATVCEFGIINREDGGLIDDIICIYVYV